MPDAGLPAPYLDPSQYPDYLAAQRKSAVAAMLMNSLQSSNQTPSDWDSMKVVPKRGLLQNVAPLVTALMANKATKDAQQAQAQYFSGLYSGGQPPASPASAQSSPPSLAPPPADPNEQSVQPLIARNGQSFSQAVGGAPPQQQPPTTGGGMVLPGMQRGQAQALLSMMGPEKYGELLASQYKPAEIEIQMRAAGIDPSSQLGRQIAQASLAKANYIAPIDARPGGTLVDPNTRQPIFTAPQNGVQTTWGPNGPQAAPVPGAQEAAARQEALNTGAKVANTPLTVPTQGGGSTVGYPGTLIGAPPALGPTAPPQTQNVPRTAPAKTGGTQGQSTGSTTSPGAPQNPWNTMPKLQISGAVGAPNAFVEGRLKAAGAKDAELASQYGKEADLADQKLQYNAEARKVLGTAEVGPSSEWLTENRAKLLEWGVPASLIPGSGSITPTMELNKQLKQSALQGARSVFGSRMTQMEVRLQHEELSPSTSMTADAINSLMQQDDIKQQYAKQRAEDYGKYVQQGGDPLRFESWYSKNFPLTQFAQQKVQTGPAVTQRTAAPPAAIAYLQQHPEFKSQFQQKYGYLP